MIKYFFYGVLIGLVVSGIIYLSGDNYHIKSKVINLDIPGELVNLKGGTFDFTSIKDSDAIIYFWGSYCAPCIENMPRLEQYAQATMTPVIMISQEDITVQEKYLSHFNYTNLQFLALTSSFKDIGVELIPKVVFKENGKYNIMSKNKLNALFIKNGLQ